MADQNLGGPTAVDLLSIGNNWIAQNNVNNDLNDRAQGWKANGDEAAAKLHNARNEIAMEYECTEESGNLYIPTLGLVSNSYCITRIQIRCAAGAWPRLSVTAHNHDDNAHNASSQPPATYTASITIAAQFGVPTMFGQANANCGKRSFTYTLECDHVDEPDGAGLHLAGQNSNGREQVVFDFSGVPSLASVPSNWDLLSSPDGGDNKDFDTVGYTYYHPLARN